MCRTLIMGVGNWCHALCTQLELCVAVVLIVLGVWTSCARPLIQQEFIRFTFLWGNVTLIGTNFSNVGIQRRGHEILRILLMYFFYLTSPWVWLCGGSFLFMYFSIANVSVYHKHAPWGKNFALEKLVLVIYTFWKRMRIAMRKYRNYPRLVCDFSLSHKITV